MASTPVKATGEQFQAVKLEDGRIAIVRGNPLRLRTPFPIDPGPTREVFHYSTLAKLPNARDGISKVLEAVANHASADKMSAMDWSGWKTA
jgi:hypothetical protein